MQRPWLYVDLDDVLCQTTRALTVLHRRRTGRRLRLADMRCFDLRVSLELDEREYESFMREAHAPEFLQGMAPVVGAARHLAAWSEQGYEIAVLTGRPPSSESCTRRWLAAHALPHHELFMVDKYGRPDWHGGSQAAMTLDELSALRFAAALEDSRTMAAFLSGRMQVPVLLIDRPWNREPAALPEGVTRVAGLGGAARRLRRLHAAH